MRHGPHRHREGEGACQAARACSCRRHVTRSKPAGDMCVAFKASLGVVGACTSSSEAFLHPISVLQRFFLHLAADSGIESELYNGTLDTTESQSQSHESVITRVTCTLVHKNTFIPE